jgi:hypothetical protein
MAALHGVPRTTRVVSTSRTRPGPKTGGRATWGDRPALSAEEDSRVSRARGIQPGNPSVLRRDIPRSPGPGGNGGTAHGSTSLGDTSAGAVWPACRLGTPGGRRFLLPQEQETLRCPSGSGADRRLASVDGVVVVLAYASYGVWSALIPAGLLHNIVGALLLSRVSGPRRPRGPVRSELAFGDCTGADQATRAAFQFAAPLPGTGGSWRRAPEAVVRRSGLLGRRATG